MPIFVAFPFFLSFRLFFSLSCPFALEMWRRRVDCGSSVSVERGVDIGVDCGVDDADFEVVAGSGAVVGFTFGIVFETI